MKSLIISIIAFISLYSLPSTHGAVMDLSYMYNADTLAYWGNRYKISTSKIMNMHILKFIYDDELQRLGNRMPVLDFPLLAYDQKVRGNPLMFYIPKSGDRIILPVLSLKFLDDLCTAYAWLQINGYSLETVSEYTAILRYGDPKKHKFPPPLKALHIPENALQDRTVNDLALAHFVTARTFILLHEMGHIYYKHYAHEAETFEQSIREEQEADRYALKMMSRLSLTPLGMLVYFMADAHWSGFPTERGTHPLSGERVRSFTAYVDSKELKVALDSLGLWLDDKDIRAGFAATGKAGDLTALAPRRPGELARRQYTPSHNNQKLIFDGIYRGKLAQNNEIESIVVELTFERNGNRVKGSFNFGVGFGKIEGYVENNTMYFDWEWVDSFGRGIFKHEGANNFNGTWGYQQARSGAGTWTCQRTSNMSQTGPNVTRVQQYLKGQKFFMTYREGGEVYGTYYFQETHFCQSGKYMLFVKSTKRTILDNEQRDSWEEYGTWDVTSYQGQTFLRFQSNTGGSQAVPIQLLPDGSLWIADGVTIQHQGRAQCQ